MAIRITRINPRTGQIERPWRNRDGFFVLGDPKHGAQRHHDKFAVKVETLDEVSNLIRRGFSLRMTDGETPAALITPESLTVDTGEDPDPDPLWFEMLPDPPFTKAAMMAELQRGLLVQANQIAHAGSRSLAAAFIGFETENVAYPHCDDDPAKVDLSRFHATEYLDLAYEYAFQVGHYWEFGDDTAQNVDEFIRGANPQASDGTPSPLADPDSLCCRAADTALGRWKLNQDLNLTVRDLALLGQMKEPAVRNSLSKERIAIEKGEIDNAIAITWLQQRRDFIPTRTEEGHKTRWRTGSRAMLDRRDFADVVHDLLRGYPIGTDELARKAGVTVDFVNALLAGRPIPDLDALVRVGTALDLDPPHFAGAAVQAALRAENRR
jgi:hypothetical protein